MDESLLHEDLKPIDYFDWIWKRIAYAQGAYWLSITFGDVTYHKIGFGFYWKK